MKSRAWGLFDHTVRTASLRQVNPWVREDGSLSYAPDYATLSTLLAVPLALNAPSQSGVPALALDVWTAYELRRAGFDADRVWPRERTPRVLPGEVSALLASLPQGLRRQVTDRIESGKAGLPASANLLGKNYVKQVDVVMSSWQTGPELLISTKRMDSSFGKNAANRVEESYGDAKNLSLRHPQAALGFLYGLRSTAFTEEPDTAAWLIDLLAKLGREDDAYDAVALVVPEWGGHLIAVGGDEPETPPGIPTLETEPELLFDLSAPVAAPVADVLELPEVVVRRDLVPPELTPERFFAVMIETVLDNSPVNLHVAARRLRREV